LILFIKFRLYYYYYYYYRCIWHSIVGKFYTINNNKYSLFYINYTYIIKLLFKYLHYNKHQLILNPIVHFIFIVIIIILKSLLLQIIIQSFSLNNRELLMFTYIKIQKFKSLKLLNFRIYL